MKKGVKIKQFDITDCGAACLASVCAYYGLQFPIARIRQYAFTDQKGTNILCILSFSPPYISLQNAEVVRVL